MRLRLFQIVHRAQSNDQVSKWYDYFIVSVAFISIVPLMFKTEHLTPEISAFLRYLDIITVFILFSDYIFRWITYDIKSGIGAKAFIVYPFTPVAIIDLLSILPSFTILNDGLKFLRVLRMVRIMRMLPGLTILTNVFIRERKALLSVVLFICVYIFTVGLIMFTVEPTMFQTFLDALYWSTTALATIGYGDITPASAWGKALATISSIVGIAVVAFPAGIITAGYIAQLQKAKQKGREYFMLPVKHDKSFKGKPISSYKNMRTYFKRNKKVHYYIMWILIGVVVSLSTTLYSNFSPYAILYFDEFGSLLISIILEPAAGIMVGLINDVIVAISIDSAYSILFFGCAAMYVATFGVLFRRGKEPTWKSYAVTIFVCTVVDTAYIALITYFNNPQVAQYDISGYFFINWIHTSFNLEPSSCFIAWYFIARVINCAISIVCVLLIRKFFWGSSIDPMMKIPVRKRYKYKIYIKKQSTHSYIQDWIEENVGEDEDDIAQLEEVVTTGKESIAESQAAIDKKQKQIDKMQKEVDEKIATIEKRKEDIAKHEEAIGVKKRAVRRVKRQIAMEDPDSMMPDVSTVINTPANVENRKASNFNDEDGNNEVDTDKK